MPLTVSSALTGSTQPPEQVLVNAGEVPVLKQVFGALQGGLRGMDPNLLALRAQHTAPSLISGSVLSSPGCARSLATFGCLIPNPSVTRCPEAAERTPQGRVLRLHPGASHGAAAGFCWDLGSLPFRENQPCQLREGVSGVWLPTPGSRQTGSLVSSVLGG